MAESQMFYAELGRRIRVVRESRGLTQEALASLISLTRTSITNIEKGRQKLLVHTLIDIAVALKATPESLLPQSQFSSEERIEELIKDNSSNEQDWIKAIVNAAHKE
jgi:transcriptional regulator with XRE-family HTH domain